MKQTKIGFFGGTFDPIHFGHLRIAETLGESLGLDEVHFIPTGVPPHRPQPKASGLQRLQWVSQAIENHHFFRVDDQEILKPTPSYTVETLEALRHTHGEPPLFYWLMGADAFVHFHTWHRWEALLELTHLVIATRPGFSRDTWHTQLSTPLQKLLKTHAVDLETLADSPSPAGQLAFLPSPPLEISSTDIRQLLKKGQSARFLMPDSIYESVLRSGVYSTKCLP